MPQTVTPNEPADQPDHYAELAAELHRVADDIATLAGSGLPKPSQFQLNIQPGGPFSSRTDDETATAVDAMAGALLGIPGRVEKMSSGSYFYATSQQRRGPLQVTIYQGVSTEWALQHDVAAAEAEMAEREAELEKARARVAELRAAAAPIAKPGFVDGPCEDLDCPNASWPHLASSDLAAPDPRGMSYTRADTDADDPTPVSPARQPLHTGGVVDGGQLVDETAPTCQHESGGGSTLRQRCGDPIRWDERYAKWLHVDAIWRGHDAVPTVDQPASAE